MIVFGLAAFDNALAVMHTMTPADKSITTFPSPATLIRALLRPSSEYDEGCLKGIREAVQCLKNKSRSFYVASGTFEGKLRIDLILLYSFCRVADDLVDNASSPGEAKEWVRKLTSFLDASYSAGVGKMDVVETVKRDFPPEARSALLLLPTKYLDKTPLYDLLKGFEMDLEFSCSVKGPATPIRTESDLDLYSARVAGTVAHSCLDLVFHHVTEEFTAISRNRLIEAGENMGIALQLVNISRDIAVDAEMQRVYIPIVWLEEVGLTAAAVIENPTGERVDELRKRLLEKAFDIYGASRAAIEELPDVARGPMRVAVESYMEIGRVLQEGHFKTKRGKATVPKWRRVFVAWKALNGGTPIISARQF
jgi:15-cis-phytoene synthase/lycopene beta-cyclase